MIYTNKADLPHAICRAIENDDYSKGDAKYSVSNLIQPIQVYHLVKRNMDKISVDYADEIWKLFGKSVHAILDASKDEGSAYIIGEQRFYMKIGDIKISGKPDLSNTLLSLTEDYKVTSVWKILKGDYKDWTEQLNMYRLILEHNDIKIDKLKIVAILKDWKKYESRGNENYPKIPVSQINIPLIPLLEVEKMMLDRIEKLEKASLLSDEDLALEYPCSEADRWAQPTTYALIKEGSKRASFTSDNKEEILNKYAENPDLKFEVRNGKSTRCEEFCLAAPFCKQFNKIKIITPDEKPPDTNTLIDKLKSPETTFHIVTILDRIEEWKKENNEPFVKPMLIKNTDSSSVLQNLLSPEPIITVPKEFNSEFEALEEKIKSVSGASSVEEIVEYSGITKDKLLEDKLFGLSFRTEDIADKKEGETDFQVAFQESAEETSSESSSFEDRFENMMNLATKKSEEIQSIIPEIKKPEGSTQTNDESLGDIFKRLGV